MHLSACTNASTSYVIWMHTLRFHAYMCVHNRHKLDTDDVCKYMHMHDMNVWCIAKCTAMQCECHIFELDAHEILKHNMPMLHMQMPAWCRCKCSLTVTIQLIIHGLLRLCYAQSGRWLHMLTDIWFVTIMDVISELKHHLFLNVNA